MNTTRRMASGLAFSPEKDLAMFADMARHGKHLDGVSGAGHGWRFRDGQPEEAQFDLAYEGSPSPDYFELFDAAGWSHVLTVGNDIHIFKAAPGTRPVHTSSESRRDELIRNRDRFLWWGLGFLALWIAAAVVLKLTSWPAWVDGTIFALLAIPVVYTLFPYVGYRRQLAKLHHSGN